MDTTRGGWCGLASHVLHEPDRDAVERRSTETPPGAWPAPPPVTACLLWRMPCRSGSCCSRRSPRLSRQTLVSPPLDPSIPVIPGWVSPWPWRALCGSSDQAEWTEQPHVKISEASAGHVPGLTCGGSSTPASPCASSLLCCFSGCSGPPQRPRLHPKRLSITPDHERNTLSWAAMRPLCVPGNSPALLKSLALLCLPPALSKALELLRL